MEKFLMPYLFSQITLLLKNLGMLFHGGMRKIVDLILISESQEAKVDKTPK